MPATDKTPSTFDLSKWVLRRWLNGFTAVAALVVGLPIFVLLLLLPFAFVWGFVLATNLSVYLFPFFFLGKFDFTAGAVSEILLVPFPLACTLAEWGAIACINGLVSARSSRHPLATAGPFVFAVWLLHYLVIHIASLPVAVRGIHP
jgi:hypothetical protein